MVRSSAKPKHSDVDPSRLITDANWAISLVRLPDSGDIEHAFLVLEGITGNTSIIWFADFVQNNKLPKLTPTLAHGKVRWDYHESKEVDGSSVKLLFRCKKPLMRIRNGDRWLYSTWAIPKATAKILIRNIKTKGKNPPNFIILGDSALAFSSASRKTHNCFTFARMMILDLHDEYIKIQQGTLEKWIVSATHRTLPDKLLDKPWWDGVRFTVSLFAILGLGIVVIAYLFLTFL
jgi:hypothetical protein